MSNKVVIHRENEYMVLHRYDSGYCEIRRVNDDNYYNVKLVHESELKKKTTAYSVA
jgi:hypothetical protein